MEKTNGFHLFQNRQKMYSKKQNVFHCIVRFLRRKLQE